jgi:hypothetical protein
VGRRDQDVTADGRQRKAQRQHAQAHPVAIPERGTISTCCGNPISGRQAWTGSSGGFIDTDVDLSRQRAACLSSNALATGQAESGKLLNFHRVAPELKNSKKIKKMLTRSRHLGHKRRRRIRCKKKEIARFSLFD